ncbi:type II secretion system F family protein [Cellulomonas sp. NTE-D12]|uniref:type II secretion system F family protein n=1 Tax=Cellulomonas sp. NTE-D12 TaxID=2962632 RepID=UPI003081EF59|nr:type II secretion system protein F [Cellulomonas sp. NTE-D12]
MATATKTYEYAVRDRSGKIIKGRVEAASQGAVAGRLREMGLAAVSIEELNTGGLKRELSIPGFGGKKVKLKDLSVMARQLATMINSGLSLLRALSILAEQTESAALSKILAQVRSDVETGVAFSVALGKHPDVFPPLMVNMVRAGEVGGFLDEVLLSIAANFEKDVQLRSKIRSAMTYPVVVFVVAILAMVGMLLFIVPIFAKMYAGLGANLPFLTRLLMVMSNGLKWTIGPVIIAIVAFAFWWKRHKNDDAVRERVDPWKLKVPVFGLLARKIAVSRFTRNFGTMIHAGVPILQALDIVGETSGNIVVEHAAKAVQESVRRGESLAGPLAQHPVFPPMVVQMISVGEDTGALDTMLAKVADFYDSEVEAMTEQLTSLIEPIMIVGVGGIIGFIVIGMYMPIFQIANVVQ